MVWRTVFACKFAAESQFDNKNHQVRLTFEWNTVTTFFLLKKEIYIYSLLLLHCTRFGMNFHEQFTTKIIIFSIQFGNQVILHFSSLATELNWTSSDNHFMTPGCQMGIFTGQWPWPWPWSPAYRFRDNKCLKIVSVLSYLIALTNGKRVTLTTYFLTISS